MNDGVRDPLTASRGTSSHSPCSSRSHSPSKPNNSPTDPPDTSSVLYASPTPQSTAISQTASLLYTTTTHQLSPHPPSPHHSPFLGGFLHDARDLLNEHLCRRVLSINLPIRLSDLACLRNEDPEIGSHSGIDESDVGAYGCDLLDDGSVDQEGGGFLLGR